MQTQKDGPPSRETILELIGEYKVRMCEFLRLQNWDITFSVELQDEDNKDCCGKVWVIAQGLEAKITLYQSAIRSRQHAVDTLLHELIHVVMHPMDSMEYTLKSVIPGQTALIESLFTIGCESTCAHLTLALCPLFVLPTEERRAEIKKGQTVNLDSLNVLMGGLDDSVSKFSPPVLGGS